MIKKMLTVAAASMLLLAGLGLSSATAGKDPAVAVKPHNGCGPAAACWFKYTP